MFLVIDIGNTALKASWADGMTLGKTFRYQGERMMDFILSLTEKERPEIIFLGKNINPNEYAEVLEYIKFIGYEYVTNEYESIINTAEGTAKKLDYYMFNKSSQK